jgi:lysophospholipase L1-like esterase
MNFVSTYVVVLFLLCFSSSLCAAGNPVKLVMFGDSVTLSKSAPDGDKVPQLVEKALNARFAGRIAWTVVNAGQGSETAEGGLRRVAGVLTKEKPQFVTIAYGLNDVGKKDPKWFEAQMTALMDAVQKHPSKPQLVVLTATPLVNETHFYGKDPFFVPFGGPDAFLDRQLNAVARRLAAARKLPLIDVHRAFVRAPEWQKLIQSDGVHPTVDGNRLVGECVAKGLSAYIEAAASSKSKAADAEKSARAKLAEAKKAATASPAKRASALKLLADAADLCPYLAEVWSALDELEAVEPRNITPSPPTGGRG